MVRQQNISHVNPVGNLPFLRDFSQKLVVNPLHWAEKIQLDFFRDVNPSQISNGVNSVDFTQKIPILG